MSSYNTLAPFYDALTGDVNYPAFADFYEKIFAEYGTAPKTILDLACGTGTLTLILARRGYEMIGADASPEMLSVAAEKAAGLKAGIKPLFLGQAMEELDLYGTVDAAVCSLDGLNYVEPELLPEIFRRLRLFIEPGGVLIFDLNTPYKLRKLDGEVFVDENDEVFCVWRAEFDQKANACFYGMDIFAKRGSMWARSFEEHTEYAHEPENLIDILGSAGFSDVRIYGDMTLLPPERTEKRVFIAAVNMK
ncbi:MAG: class I SAM-dependent methyltransferase [Oscillospiraceae bacterium]